MKILALFFGMALGSTLTASAGPEDRYMRPVLDCKVGAFGVDTLTVREDDYGREGVELELLLSNGSYETRVIAEKEFLKLGNEELFIKMDGELSITLSKSRVDQYIYDYSINRRGDGFNESVMISCVEQ